MALAVVRLWLLVAFAVMLAAPSAVAAPKPATKGAEKTKPEAARRLEAGDEALKAGDAATAIREYEAARAIQPSFEAALGIARAERSRGDALKARTALQAISDEFGSKLGDKQKSQLEAERALVASGVAKLALDVKEPGASVTLDGRAVGTTPLSAPIELNAGRYELSVTKPGFVADVRKLELAGGQTRVVISLVRESKTGKLVVTAQGTEPVTVLLNDQSAGTAPLTIDVAPGTYTISGKGATKRAAPQTIQVELGQTTNVALVAQDVPGTARVSAGDPEAVIYIDDRAVGKGDWQAELAPGPHQLRIERPGYEAHSQALEIVPAERVIVDQVPYRAKGGPGDPAAYKGIFVNVGLLGLFGVSPTNELAVDCPANATGGGCASRAPAGGGLAARVGYQLGWVGFEGILLGSVDVSTTEANYEFGTPPELGDYYGVARNEQYAFVRYGFGGGVGARFTSEDQLLRFSGGLSGVLLWRTAQYTRATNSTEGIADATDDTSETESYVNPGVMTDIGVMIGSTPGIKFHAGLTFLVEFAPERVAVPGIESGLGGFMPGSTEPYGTPEVDVSREAQFMFGPFLAMQIGR